MSKSRIILLLLLIYPAYLTVHYGIRNYAESQVKNEVLAEIAKDPQLVSVFGGPYVETSAITIQNYQLNFPQPANSSYKHTSSEKFAQYINQVRPLKKHPYSILAYDITQEGHHYQEYQLSICGEFFCNFDPGKVVKVTRKRFENIYHSQQKVVDRHVVRYGHDYDVEYVMYINGYEQPKGYAIFLVTYPETFWDGLLRQLVGQSPEGRLSNMFYSATFATKRVEIRR